ncbi:hypothetical protein PHISCL_07989 [Aspergillus sclerotialis]|uniref:Uncharacterized protein n=1 Tax=Aspergillus sclerotialis TaxID=2070753 RepID=A0A3A2Z984_9EURO|nr:hypothetical protein PHISCL_07989 [Aspergillus sclerotialis]
MDQILWNRQAAATSAASPTTKESSALNSPSTWPPPVPGVSDTSKTSSSVTSESPNNTADASTSWSTRHPSSSAATESSSLTLSSSLIPSSTTSAADAASGSSTSLTTSQASHSSSGVSNGALAGAIVASVIGASALSLLLAFLYFRRGQRDRTQDPNSTAPVTPKGPGQIYTQGLGPPLAPSHEKRPNVASVALGPQLLNLSSFVPAPADDDTVCTRIQTLFDQASLHIDNYYSKPPTKLNLVPEQLACINRYDSPYLPSKLVNMLSKHRVQRAVLTHVLVQTLLQAIRRGTEAGSLLPPPYMPVSQQSENTDFNFGKVPHFTCFVSKISNWLCGIDDERAVFAWRMLTAHLYNQSRSAQEPVSAAAQEATITNLTENFTATFASYSDPHFTKADRLAHLTSVVKVTAELGAWLFAQPCSFDFRWTAAAAASGEVTVLPAVLKVCDEQGQPLLVPQVLAEGVTVSI